MICHDKDGCINSLESQWRIWGFHGERSGDCINSKPAMRFFQANPGKPSFLPGDHGGSNDFWEKHIEKNHFWIADWLIPLFFGAYSRILNHPSEILKSSNTRSTSATGEVSQRTFQRGGSVLSDKGAPARSLRPEWRIAIPEKSISKIFRFSKNQCHIGLENLETIVTRQNTKSS